MDLANPQEHRTSQERTRFHARPMREADARQNFELLTLSWEEHSSFVK
jgi:hypothetical protein